METRKIIAIFALPVLVFLFGVGWLLYVTGQWVYHKSKSKYNQCVEIIKTEGITT